MENRLKVIQVVILSIFLCACATKPQWKPLATPARVLAILAIDSLPIHNIQGTPVKPGTSFVKTDFGHPGWKLRESFGSILNDRIEARTNWTVEVVNAPPGFPHSISSIADFNSWSNVFTIKPDAAAVLRGVAQEAGVDTLLLVTGTERVRRDPFPYGLASYCPLVCYNVTVLGTSISVIDGETGMLLKEVAIESSNADIEPYRQEDIDAHRLSEEQVQELKSVLNSDFASLVDAFIVELEASR